MSLDHEYAFIGGINRARIGRWLAVVAATVSGWAVFLLLSGVNLAQKLGISVNLPPSVLSLAGAGSLFGVLYWLFERYIWGWGPASRLLKVADLRGTWRCTGQALKPDGSPSHQWKGTLTISQSWDKIRVRLKTAQFGSNSISAALLHDSIDGYRLLYYYKNEPTIGEAELSSHCGFAELVFAKDLLSADGEYFNGRGSCTFGTIRLKRAGGA